LKRAQSFPRFLTHHAIYGAWIKPLVFERFLDLPDIALTGGVAAGSSAAPAHG
jgi:hypothetical protein